MTTDPVLRPLASLLNRQLQRSSEAQAAATALDGRVLALRLRGTGLVLQLALNDGELVLGRGADIDPDAELETTPLGLAELARGETTGGRLAMNGDPVVARDFERLLRATRPDWEDELSRIVGDVAAHEIGNAVRSLLAFGRHAAERLSRDTAEYLSEESRDLPTRAEIDRFNAGVREVAGRVEDLRRATTRLREALGG